MAIGFTIEVLEPRKFFTVLAPTITSGVVKVPFGPAPPNTAGSFAEITIDDLNTNESGYRIQWSEDAVNWPGAMAPGADVEVGEFVVGPNPGQGVFNVVHDLDAGQRLYYRAQALDGANPPSGFSPAVRSTNDARTATLQPEVRATPAGLRISWSIVVMALCFAQVIAAPAPAAPFVNLDFEQAQVQPINPNFIVAATGMPGWTPRIGGVQIANLDYNSIGIGLPAVSLFDREDTQLGLPIPQGLFYAALSSGITLEAEASMEQRGDIPADARSLHLMAQAFESRPMIVLQDQTLPLVQLSPPFPGNGWRWAIFGCDISAFAGVEDAFLKITTGPRGGGAFDDIRFSATQVPEPWANVLVLISAVVLARRRANQGGDFESDAFICGVR